MNLNINLQINDADNFIRNSYFKSYPNYANYTDYSKFKDSNNQNNNQFNNEIIKGNNGFNFGNNYRKNDFNSNVISKSINPILNERKQKNDYINNNNTHNNFNLHNLNNNGTSMNTCNYFMNDKNLSSNINFNYNNSLMNNTMHSFGSKNHYETNNLLNNNSMFYTKLDNYNGFSNNYNEGTINYNNHLSGNFNTNLSNMNNYYPNKHFESRNSPNIKNINLFDSYNQNNNYNYEIQNNNRKNSMCFSFNNLESNDIDTSNLSFKKKDVLISRKIKNKEKQEKIKQINNMIDNKKNQHDNTNINSNLFDHNIKNPGSIIENNLQTNNIINNSMITPSSALKGVNIINSLNFCDDIDTAIHQLKYSNLQIRNQDILDKINFELHDLIKLIVKQFDFYLQLVIQNAMMINPKQKHRSINILEKFYNDKELIINTLKLAKKPIKIDKLNCFNNDKPLLIAPQISIFQVPILEICPYIKDIIYECWDFEKVKEILNDFKPFINPYFLPLSKKRNVNKREDYKCISLINEINNHIPIDNNGNEDKVYNLINDLVFDNENEVENKNSNFNKKLENENLDLREEDSIINEKEIDDFLVDEFDSLCYRPDIIDLVIEKYYQKKSDNNRSKNVSASKDNNEDDFQNDLLLESRKKDTNLI